MVYIHHLRYIQNLLAISLHGILLLLAKTLGNQMELIQESIIHNIFQSSANPYNDFLNYFLSIQIPILETRLAISQTIYRARYSEPDTSLNEYSEYIYPPSNNSFSRIGIPGDIWFYGSDNKIACIAEMLPFWYNNFELGSSIKVSFGFWQIRQPVNVLVIPDLELKNEIAKAMKLNERYSEIDRKFWNYISPYFYESTKTNPNIYKLTSALISSLIIRSELTDNKIDGIAYPSVQHREKTNVALKPSVIDNHQLVFKKAVDMIFNKHKILNTSGLPNYFGPSDEREGTLNRKTQKIEWL